MEENKTNTQNEGNTQQTEGTSSSQEEKKFTQEDVNRIVQERLTRERGRAGQTLEDREKELARRESRMTCAERLSEKGYSKDLLDILDTSDADKFMENVAALEQMGLNGSASKLPRVVSVTSGMIPSEDADLREAFGLNEKES